MEKLLVGVHWNSHKKCWSVVNFKSRKTVALLNCHMSELCLHDVSFKVDMSKKRKALEIGKKDRHTFIVGYLCVEKFESDNHIFQDILKYHVGDNTEPFKDTDGQSVLGKSLYFSNNAKVYIM